MSQMNIRIFYQNPECYDEQGLYVKYPGEEDPWTTETDAEEFDYWHKPSEAGWAIRDLESAQRWATENLKGDLRVIEASVW